MPLFSWTGNPFVDTGLMVILHLTNKNDISELSYENVTKVLGDGKELAGMNAKLKSFTMVFGRNGPLTNGYGYKQGTPSEKNHQIYINLVKGLLNASQIKEQDGYICEICGINTNFNFANLYEQVLSNAGEKIKEGKVLGREWFPLSGSLGSDAQALPSASRAMNICPSCLFSIHYLPVALILLKATHKLGARVTVFQSNSQLFTIDLVTAIVDDTINHVKAGNGDTIGKKEGTKVLTGRLLNLFEKLQKEKKRNNLPDYTNLLIWKFSNSGTGADCELEEIPNNGLMFLWETVNYGLRLEIDKLLANESKDPRFQLLTAIREGKDYKDLYPYKKKPSANTELFVLYQLKICNVAKRALIIAQKIASKYFNSLDNKGKKNIKSEIFKDNTNRSKARRLMADMAEIGELDFDDYTQLFVEISRHPIKVDWKGWDLIRFFLYHPEDKEWEQKFNKIEEGGSKVKPHPLIKKASELYFKDYVERRSLERFHRDIIEGFRRGTLKRKWLEDVFIRLAEKGNDEFTIEDWDVFCCDENGIPVLNELLFQMRLNLANLYGNKIKEGKQNG